MAEGCHDKKKRVRDGDDSGEFGENLPQSKIARVDSDSEIDTAESRISRTNSEGCELVRVDSEIHDDLLDILDDSDNVADRDPTMQGLDSVIKSFEEEILAPGADPDPNEANESCDLRHLLEASDDELGLPPTVTPPAEEEDKAKNEDFSRLGPDGIDLSGFLGFEDDISHYESLGYGSGVFVEYGGDDNGGGFVTLDGLFDYADPGDLLWRSESLQAM